MLISIYKDHIKIYLEDGCSLTYKGTVDKHTIDEIYKLSGPSVDILEQAYDLIKNMK